MYHPMSVSNPRVDLVAGQTYYDRGNGAVARVVRMNKRKGTVTLRRTGTLIGRDGRYPPTFVPFDNPWTTTWRKRECRHFVNLEA